MSKGNRGNTTSGEERKGGPPKKDECVNGHDLSVHGRQRFTKAGKKNGRQCELCKNKHTRNWYYNQQLNKAIKETR